MRYDVFSYHEVQAGVQLYIYLHPSKAGTGGAGQALCSGLTPGNGFQRVSPEGTDMATLAAPRWEAVTVAWLWVPYHPLAL